MDGYKNSSMINEPTFFADILLMHILSRITSDTILKAQLVEIYVYLKMFNTFLERNYEQNVLLVVIGENSLLVRNCVTSSVYLQANSA